MSKERKIEDKDLSKITGGAVDVQSNLGGPHGPVPVVKSEGGSTPGSPGQDQDSEAPGGGTTDFSTP